MSMTRRSAMTASLVGAAAFLWELPMLPRSPLRQVQVNHGRKWKRIRLHLVKEGQTFRMRDRGEPWMYCVATSDGRLGKEGDVTTEGIIEARLVE